MAFDSREYEWADITLLVGGKDITGIRGVKYGSKQEKEAVFGKGNLPLKIQKGNITFDGELSMLQSDYETLRANATDGSVLSLQLNCVVCYGNPSKGDVIITDVLQGVQFTEDAKDWKQGDKFTEIKLPFIFLRKRTLPK